MSGSRGRFREQVDAYRRLLIENAVRAHGGNRTLAAAYLGLTRSSIQRLIRQLRPILPARADSRRAA